MAVRANMSILTAKVCWNGRRSNVSWLTVPHTRVPATTKLHVPSTVWVLRTTRHRLSADRRCRLPATVVTGWQWHDKLCCMRVYSLWAWWTPMIATCSRSISKLSNWASTTRRSFAPRSRRNANVSRSRRGRRRPLGSSDDDGSYPLGQRIIPTWTTMNHTHLDRESYPLGRRWIIPHTHLDDDESYPLAASNRDIASLYLVRCFRVSNTNAPTCAFHAYKCESPEIVWEVHRWKYMATENATIEIAGQGDSRKLKMTVPATACIVLALSMDSDSQHLFWWSYFCHLTDVTAFEKNKSK